MKKVAFICVHNSCRSQIAEALCRVYRKDLEVYSAGTEIKPKINKDAIRIMKEKYNIDMTNQYFSECYQQLASKCFSYLT